MYLHVSTHCIRSFGFLRTISVDLVIIWVLSRLMSISPVVGVNFERQVDGNLPLQSSREVYGSIFIEFAIFSSDHWSNLHK